VGIVFIGETNIGRKRSVNEDSLWPKTEQHEYASSSYGMLFIVADGMGGHGAGDIASQIAVETIPTTYYALDEKYTDVRDRLVIAIEEAHRQICTRATQSPETQRMGTTVVAVVIKYNEVDKQRQAWVAWAGDSRVYLLRAGKLNQVTKDHSKLWPLIEAKQITWEALRLHPDRSKITNSLTAVRSSVRPDVLGPLALKPDDQFLLCSDGLTGEVRDEEIEHTLITYPPQQAVSLLIEKANSPKEIYKGDQRVHLDGGGDNITSIVIKIPDDDPTLLPSPPPASPTKASKRKNFVIAAVLILFLISAGALVFLLFNPTGAEPTTSVNQTQATIVPTETPNQESIVVAIADKATPSPAVEENGATTQDTIPPSPENLIEPTATRRVSGTSTPPPTPTPPLAPTPTSTSSPSPTATQLPAPELGTPAETDDAFFTGQPTKFTWTWAGGSLPEQLGFEIRIWLDGTESIGAYDANQMREEPAFLTTIGAGRTAQYSFSFDLAAAASVQQHKTNEQYRWSVAIVQLEPAYKDLDIESKPRRIRIAVPGEGAGE
jgi:serine/threonine protein phosphatase PrpC